MQHCMELVQMISIFEQVAAACYQYHLPVILNSSFIDRMPHDYDSDVNLGPVLI